MREVSPQNESKSILDVGLEVVRKAVEDGHGGAVTLVIAAVVDLIEEEAANENTPA